MSSYLSQFNYQIYGPEEGAKWVFLHGLMGYGLNWRKIAASLEASERVLTFDQRGHGKSWKPLTGYGPDDYAEDLYLITQELGWNDFYLVGHSMGGRNALIFADRFPDKVKKLVIEDIGPEGGQSSAQYYKDLFARIPTPFIDKKSAKDFLYNDFRQTAKELGQPDTLGAYLYSNLIEKEDGSVDWRFSKEAMIETVVLGRGKSHWDEFKRLKIPTLIIRGESSRELPFAVYEEMLAANPEVAGVQIANAGHWVHADQPEAFTRALREFISP